MNSFMGRKQAGNLVYLISIPRNDMAEPNGIGSRLPAMLPAIGTDAIVIAGALGPFLCGRPATTGRNAR